MECGIVTHLDKLLRVNNMYGRHFKHSYFIFHPFNRNFRWTLYTNSTKKRASRASALRADGVYLRVDF